MKDFHAQICYHLEAIEDLLATDILKLSISQLQMVLTHQAYALEQSVKLAAIARLPEGKQPEALTKLLRASHRPSEFLSSFVPMRLNADQTGWHRALQSAIAVDGFLTGPARYAVITHPWMGLLADLSEAGETISEQNTEVIQLIHDNLSALQLFLADIHQSLPLPQGPFVTSSSPTGYLDGLKDKNLLQIPSPPVYVSYSLFDALNHLSQVDTVLRLSHYEALSHLVQRRKEFQIKLRIIQANIEQIEELLQEPCPYSWCSSYSSTLLLRAAVVLEGVPQ